MVTTTLINVIQSELISLGKNELFNNNQITAYNDDFTFINKALKYDKDIKYIMNEKIFLGLALENPKHDDKFKRHFLNRFIHYEIAFQTIEIFSSTVSYIFLNNMDFLNNYYENIDDFIKGKNTTDNKGNEGSISTNRQATATLPQSEVNIDLNDDTFSYADENNINKNKTSLEREGQTTSFSFDIDKLEKSKALLEYVFEDFERACFLKVW